ncbi:MAG: hypothetical protein AAF389_21070 [Gemmatimonadota bacterium]
MGETQTVLLAASERAFGSEEAQLLMDSLRGRGVEAAESRWDTHDPRPGTSVVIRHTWDYHKRLPDFTVWLDRLEDAGTRVFNSVPLIRWNAEKGYLVDLAQRGVRTPTTLFYESRDVVPDGAELSARLGTDRAVIKPTVSATSWHTRLVSLDDRRAVLEAVDAAAGASRAMVQAFVPEIGGGEWSLVYFGGVFSHAVLKRPVSGEFRVQSDFGGSVELGEPPAAALDIAERCLAAAPESPTFARVDGVETDDGFLLMELELIEPDLFFRLHAPASARLAELIAEGAT